MGGTKAPGINFGGARSQRTSSPESLSRLTMEYDWQRIVRREGMSFSVTVKLRTTELLAPTSISMCWSSSEYNDVLTVMRTSM